jgi:hypothetical protein
MPRLAICPARDPGAVANIAKSVVPGLSRGLLVPRSTLAGWSTYPAGRVSTWGVPDDVRGRNRGRWERRVAGDVVVLYNEPDIFGIVGTVWDTEESTDVSSLA